MVQTGIVEGREIRKNQDGNFLVRLLQCRVTDSEDIQTVQFISQSGEDSSPPNGAAVLIINVGETAFAVAAEDNLTPEAATGDKHLYSIDGDTKPAEIKIKTGGDIELNGNADSAVRFTALAAVLNQLVTDINVQLTAIDGALAGYTAVPVTIDPSPAEVTDVKLP